MMVIRMTLTGYLIMVMIRVKKVGSMSISIRRRALVR